jgi:acetoin utilization protein AcuB
MFVRDFMTKKVITAPPDMLIHDAQQLMKQNHIRRLPVVDNGKLIGIVTQSRLREVSPSPATSLSVWELNYILAKMKVSEAMSRNVITTTPDTTLEDAALLGNRHGVGALPVVEGGRLVGMITATDIYNIFIEVLGTREKGVRLQIHQHEASKTHIVGEIATVLNKCGFTIHSIFKVQPPGRPHPDIIVRLTTQEADVAIEELTELGYKVEVS